MLDELEACRKGTYPGSARCGGSAASKGCPVKDGCAMMWPWPAVRYSAAVASWTGTGVDVDDLDRGRAVAEGGDEIGAGQDLAERTLEAEERVHADDGSGRCVADDVGAM